MYTRTIKVTDWAAEARGTAEVIASEYTDEILEAYIEEGGFRDGRDAINSSGLEVFRDSAIHEACDSSFIYGGLVEWAQCIEQLSEHQETDTGLWQGCDAEKTIQAMAFYTFQNAVTDALADILTEIIGLMDDAGGDVEDNHEDWDSDSEDEAKCGVCGLDDILNPAKVCEECDGLDLVEKKKAAFANAVEDYF